MTAGCWLLAGGVCWLFVGLLAVCWLFVGCGFLRAISFWREGVGLSEIYIEEIVNVDNPLSREEGKKLSHPTQQSNTQNPNQSESGVTFLNAAAPTHHPNQRPNQINQCQNQHPKQQFNELIVDIVSSYGLLWHHHHEACLCHVPDKAWNESFFSTAVEHRLPSRTASGR